MKPEQRTSGCLFVSVMLLASAAMFVAGAVTLDPVWIVFSIIAALSTVETVTEIILKYINRNKS